MAYDYKEELKNETKKKVMDMDVEKSLTMLFLSCVDDRHSSFFYLSFLIYAGYKFLLYLFTM